MANKNVNSFLTVSSLNLSTASILAIVGGELKRFTGQTIAIDSAGNVGIGITNPVTKLDINGTLTARGSTQIVGGTLSLTRTSADYNVVSLNNTSGVEVQLNANGNTEGNLRTVTSHPLSFSTNNTERLRINSSGNVGINNNTPLVQTHIRYARSGGAANDTIAGLFLDAYYGEATAPTVGSSIYLRSSRSATLGTQAVSVNGDDSRIRFYFSDGSNFVPAAAVNASVDGVPATGSVAGKLLFLTTSAAATVPSTKMTIDKAGIVTITNLGTGTVSSTAGVLSAASDARMKISDGEIENAINKIQNLKPKYFYWKDENNNKDESKGRQLGFFAQEVNEQVPEAAPGLNDQWGIYDRSLIAVLVKAVQELKVEIDILKNK
jgi:hypothetical protein